MKPVRALLLSLLFAGAIGCTLFLLQSTLLARQRIIENAASGEKPITAVDMVTTELKPKSVNISEPFASEAGNLKTEAANLNKQQAGKAKSAEQRDAHVTTDSTDSMDEAIQSFQKTAQLLTARLDPGVISQLDLDASDASLDH
jgi:hypothetical protein